ncbi:MAG: NAD(P)/FAD-dependent oxidoreductase [Phycisphaerales bacterium JB059]
MGPPALDKPLVVIVGAGFAGLAAARELGRADAFVLVIDRANHHTFQPLLYQVATAGLSPADIAAPVRRILARQRNTGVLMGDVVEIGEDSVRVRTLTGDERTVQFDHLIVAAGKEHDYFGHEDAWSAHAPGLKTIDDALEIRRRVLSAFELAESTDDPAERAEAMTFVIVGAGPTGVEMAGALAEIATQVIRQDFRRINTANARIILVEGGSRVLAGYREASSASALRQIRSLGVDVRLNTMVTGIDGRGVSIASGDAEERIGARTVIWAAGVRAASIAAQLSEDRTRDGRVRVRADLTVPGRPNVFVVGDMAHVESEGAEVPGVAPAAMQMGRHAGRTVAGILAGKPGARQDFVYRDKGALATIGRHRAVADLGGRSFGGFFAWLLWAGVHVFFLIGFRNKLLVMIQWVWSYITFGRGARLITQKPAGD